MCHCITPQGIGSLVGLKYSGPQNLSELIERCMRKSSEVQVPWGPISHRQLLYLLLFFMSPESSSFSVPTVSASLSDKHHYYHSPISGFCPALLPVLQFLSLYLSCFILDVAMSYLLWKPLGFSAHSWSAKCCSRHLSQPPPALPQVYYRDHLDLDSLERPPESQSAFMRQKIQKSQSPIFNSVFQSKEDYCHRLGTLDTVHFCWSQDS